VNEVRELCEQALDGAEPPLRDATEVLAVARRATRTRDLRRVAAGLAAVAALAAGAAVVTPAAVGSVASEQPVSPATAARPSPTPPPAPPAPTSEQAVEHMPQIAGMLAEAMPEGYAFVRLDRYREQPAWYADLADDSYVVIWTAQVASGTGTGVLEIIIRGDQPGPSGDLCEPEISAGFAAPAAAWCWQAWSEEGPIWIITGRDDGRGDVHAATRVLDGGYLTVVVEQAVDDGGSSPPLARLPFTATELAALVADPAMLP
jgi:hypothetical protein